MNRTTLGGLHAVVTGGADGQGGGDGPVVVLLHGFGAPGDDLVPLARFLAVPRAVRFVFPAAPRALDLGFGPGDSRAWWMIDIERIQRELASGQPRNLVREVPVGLPAARAQVIALLDDVAGKLGGGRVVLGGFSQGAMLACDVALRTARPLAGLVLLSGTLLAEDEWVPLMPARRGLPVLESHGQLDPLLPFFVAEMLRDHLVAAGLAVEWVPFRGGHEIPAPVLDRLGAFLGRALADG
jgi:phospholipase/carboxylesterase